MGESKNEMPTPEDTGGDMAIWYVMITARKAGNLMPYLQ